MPKYRHIAHYLAGIIIALSCIIHWTLPLLGAGLFVLYEIRQHKRLKDWAYFDILECLIGFLVACGGLVICTFLEVI